MRAKPISQTKEADLSVKSFQKIIDLFLQTVRMFPNHIFLRIREGGEFRTVTYEEALDRVRKVGYFLKEKGFRPGERAAVVGENCPEWIISYLGIQWVGGTGVPLDSRATPTEWIHLMRHSECRFVFCAPAFYQDIDEVKDTLPTLQEIVSFKRSESDWDLPLIFQTMQGLPEPAHRLREDVAVLLYTSGTTGSSKGVMLTHGNLLANIEQVVNVLEIKENDRFFSVLPIHHSFESTCGLLLPMTEGASK